MIYWVRELKRTVKDEDSKPLPGDGDTKDWVYDLIKNKNEMVFVAEVPGPEEQIDIRLTIGTLHVKSGQNFSKTIPLDLIEEMNISDFKYRNGILTIKDQQGLIIENFLPIISFYQTLPFVLLLAACCTHFCVSYP